MQEFRYLVLQLLGFDIWLLEPIECKQGKVKRYLAKRTISHRLAKGKLRAGVYYA